MYVARDQEKHIVDPLVRRAAIVIKIVFLWIQHQGPIEADAGEVSIQPGEQDPQFIVDLGVGLGAADGLGGQLKYPRGCYHQHGSHAHGYEHLHQGKSRL